MKTTVFNKTMEQIKTLYEVNFNGNSKSIERVTAFSKEEAIEKIYKIYDKNDFEVTKIYEQ